MLVRIMGFCFECQCVSWGVMGSIFDVNVDLGV